jgi:hypothetical protein
MTDYDRQLRGKYYHLIIMKYGVFSLYKHIRKIKHALCNDDELTALTLRLHIRKLERIKGKRNDTH